MPHGEAPPGAQVERRIQTPPTMTRILCLAGTLALLCTTGCLYREGGPHREYRGRGRYEHHAEVIVGPPAIEVRPPAIIIH